MREGVARDGHRLYPAMPYTAYAKMSDKDLEDLYHYLMKEVQPLAIANKESDIPWPLNMRWPLKGKVISEFGPKDNGLKNEGINIDLGMFIIAGLLFSIPLFIFSVFLFRWFGNKYPQFVVPYEIDRSKYTEAQLKVLDKIDAKIKAGKELENEDFTELLSTEKLPSAGLSFTILLLPVFLILANTLVSQTAFKATIVGEIITFLGNPVIALFISLCLGAFLLAKDLDNKTVVGMMNDALRDAGPIVMITAGGGALGAVVKATGAAGMMANGIVAIGIPGILVPLLIGTIMRFPQGSGTTAMITGSAIIAPMLVTLSINPSLAGLAVCLTAMCPSFLNDSYFHVVTSFSGMDIKTSLKTWTIGSILVPIFGSVIICILSLFIH